MSEKIPKIIFIVPYRSRKQQLIHFKMYMTRYILEDYNLEDYEIFFVHQFDSRPFNRGAMKNIGFIAMKEKYPDHYKNITFVFNDIDTLPSFKDLLDYKTVHGYIKHFYGFEYTLGGIVSVTGRDFEMMNGFPNYWAWGLEDNDLQHRVRLNNFTIDRRVFFKFGDPNIISINSTTNRIQSKQQPWRCGPKNKEGITDITNLKYNFENDMIHVHNFITPFDPAKDNYVNEKHNARVHFDNRFRPNNALVNNYDVLQANKDIMKVKILRNSDNPVDTSVKDEPKNIPNINIQNTNYLPNNQSIINNHMNSNKGRYHQMNNLLKLF